VDRRIEGIAADLDHRPAGLAAICKIPQMVFLRCRKHRSTEGEKYPHLVRDESKPDVKGIDSSFYLSNHYPILFDIQNSRANFKRILQKLVVGDNPISLASSRIVTMGFVQSRALVCPESYN